MHLECNLNLKNGLKPTHILSSNVKPNITDGGLALMSEDIKIFM